MTRSDTPDYASALTIAQADIPVVDPSDMHAPSGRREIAMELVRAASDLGFFYVAGHGVPDELCETAMSASRRFFEMPEPVKAAISIDQHQRGWMAQGGLANLEGYATHDAKEVFFWGRDVDPDDEQVRAGLPLVHPNQWPDRDAPFLRTGIMPC